ncbi:MAG: uroporphyrinogen-III synthase [Geodermatophilaceae bacterium]
MVSGDPFSCDAVVKETLAVARTTVPFDVVPRCCRPVRRCLRTPASRSDPPTPTADLRVKVDQAALAAAPGTLALQLPAELVGRDMHGTGQERAGRQAPRRASRSTGPASVSSHVVSTVDDLAAGDGREWISSGIVGAHRSVRPWTTRSRLSWWESRALYGWRVLVPRTKEQAGVMSDRLQLHGAIPVEVPTIAVEPPRTPAQMERAIKGLVTGRYGWIVFTSTNAVRAVWERFGDFGLDARAFAGVKIACVGDADRRRGAARWASGRSCCPTGEQSSEGLLEDFPPYDDVLDPIDRVLLPRADIATETLAAGLRERAGRSTT